MKDITLRDGTVVPRGTTIIATTYDIHHNSAKYENPDVFDPFRFSRVRADSEEERVKNQLVNTSVDYMPFGHGKHAWYVVGQSTHAASDHYTDRSGAIFEALDASLRRMS